MSNSATESGPEVTSLPQFFPPVPMSESLKADTECGDGGIFLFFGGVNLGRETKKENATALET